MKAGFSKLPSINTMNLQNTLGVNCNSLFRDEVKAFLHGSSRRTPVVEASTGQNFMSDERIDEDGIRAVSDMPEHILESIETTNSENFSSSSNSLPQFQAEGGTPKRSGKNKCYTPSEDQFIMDSRAAGMKLKSIGDILGRSANAISLRCLDLKTKHLVLADGRIPAGKPGVNRKWTQQDDEFILEMRDAGKSWRWIGSNLPFQCCGGGHVHTRYDYLLALKRDVLAS